MLCSRKSLALVTVALSLVGCMSSPTTLVTRLKPSARESIQDLTDGLVTAAALRVPLASMRVLVDRLEPLGGRQDEDSGGPNDLAGELMFPPALERDLRLALASRLYIFDEPQTTNAIGSSARSLNERAADLGATHAVLGDWVATQRGIELSLRLVDLESGLIVAPARTVLPQPEGWGAAVLPIPSAVPQSSVAPAPSVVANQVDVASTPSSFPEPSESLEPSELAESSDSAASLSSTKSPATEQVPPQLESSPSAEVLSQTEPAQAENGFEERFDLALGLGAHRPPPVQFGPALQRATPNEPTATEAAPPSETDIQQAGAREHEAQSEAAAPEPAPAASGPGLRRIIEWVERKPPMEEGEPGDQPPL